MCEEQSVIFSVFNTWKLPRTFQSHLTTEESERSFTCSATDLSGSVLPGVTGNTPALTAVRLPGVTGKTTAPTAVRLPGVTGNTTAPTTTTTTTTNNNSAVLESVSVNVTVSESAGQQTV